MTVYIGDSSVGVTWRALTNADLVALAGGNWKVLYQNGSGLPTELALGAAATYLRGGGVAAAPTFAVPAPTELVGGNWKVLYTNGSGVIVELPLGAAGTVLTSNGASSAPTFAAAGGMLKTQNTGFFMIPTGPAVDTTVTSGSADAYNATWTEMIASTAAALYIVGASINCGAAGSTATYVQFELGTGGAGSESVISEFKIGLKVDNIPATRSPEHFEFPYPIPVAASTRISANSADPAGGLGWKLGLLCIKQSDLVTI